MERRKGEAEEKRGMVRSFHSLCVCSLMLPPA